MSESVLAIVVCASEGCPNWGEINLSDRSQEPAGSEVLCPQHEAQKTNGMGMLEEETAMDMPTKRVVHSTRHEWRIDSPATRRQVEDALLCAKRDMEGLGIDLHWDDAFHVAAEDEEIVIYHQSKFGPES